MNLAAVLLCLSFLVLVLLQAVSFHQSTVCRQKGRLLALEKITRSLLSDQAFPGFASSPCSFRDEGLHLNLRGKL